jgi:transposase
MARTYITDYIWSIIVLLLPAETGGKGHRLILEGIIWRLRTGAPEWELPPLEGKTTDAVIADKGYDSDSIREKIKELDAEPVIPYRKNRKESGTFDKYLYGARHDVENFFAKLKQLRSAAFRHDKTSLSFRGMFTLACILIWARL